MSHIERKVSRHYGDDNLLSRLHKAITASGLDLDNLQADDLTPVEEFHIGGRPATAYALSKLSITAKQQVLDIGCGIGGAVRFIAGQSGCKVTGIDLTPEYIACAKDLSHRLGMDDLNKFHTASALDLPFSEHQFDAAISLHVAMNIEDRAALYQETARVLKSGGTFCLFDVMRKDAGPIQFPVPWAASAETSFLKTPEQMRALLQNAGFAVDLIEDRSEMAISFFQQRIKAAQNEDHTDPPALGIHLIMKDRAKEKFQNTLANIKNGLVAPVLMIATRL